MVSRSLCRLCILRTQEEPPCRVRAKARLVQLLTGTHQAPQGACRTTRCLHLAATPLHQHPEAASFSNPGWHTPIWCARLCLRQELRGLPAACGGALGATLSTTAPLPHGDAAVHQVSSLHGVSRLSTLCLVCTHTKTPRLCRLFAARVSSDLVCILTGQTFPRNLRRATKGLSLSRSCAGIQLPLPQTLQSARGGPAEAGDPHMKGALREGVGQLPEAPQGNPCSTAGRSCSDPCQQLCRSTSGWTCTAGRAVRAQGQAPRHLGAPPKLFKERGAQGLPARVAVCCCCSSPTPKPAGSSCPRAG